MASDTQPASGDGRIADQTKDLVAAMTALLVGYPASVGISALGMMTIKILVGCYQDPHGTWEDHYDAVSSLIDPYIAELTAANAKKKDEAKDYVPE